MIKLKSLFGKMMISYVIALLVLIVMINLMLTQVFLDTEVRTNFELMELIGDEVSADFEMHYEIGMAQGDFSEKLSRTAKNHDADIFITDRYGTNWYNAAGGEKLTEYRDKFNAQKEEMLISALSGRSVTYSYYENSIYYTPVLIRAMPLVADDNIVGSIFVIKRLNSYENTLNQIYMRFTLSSVMSFFVAAVFVFFSSRQIERPLLEIDRAAENLAKGNFSGRVHIDESSSTAVTELAETFNTMAAELEKYENTRSSFVANVSHELRSPLTSVHGFLQGVLDGTIPQEESRQYLEIALSETERMTALISDLMELAKAESGQFPLNLTEYDVNEQIRTCIISKINLIEEKKVDLVVNIPEEETRVVADMDRIAQVLTNILDNAVKFVDEGGQLKIWSYVAERKLYINVLNTGTVIAAEDIPFVFDRFFKADKSHNRSKPGTGIGLSLVKNIINRHGEDVFVNSDKENGTVFTFSLALAS
ncbi:MAG: HAMP domain-containing histidine kinase [Christensenellaceae bacterium]|nr:HAMP domain-containing histidine kinase [Christensenellaceae bacterium]